MDNAKTCRFGFIHVIEQGDTLYKLGKRYGVTVFGPSVCQSLGKRIQSADRR